MILNNTSSFSSSIQANTSADCTSYLLKLSFLYFRIHFTIASCLDYYFGILNDLSASTAFSPINSSQCSQSNYAKDLTANILLPPESLPWIPMFQWVAFYASMAFCSSLIMVLITRYFMDCLFVSLARRSYIRTNTLPLLITFAALVICKALY